MTTDSSPEEGPAIVWFRNDLRIADNAALCAAKASGAPIIAIFILDEQTSALRTRGGASRWWLEQSLTRLASNLDGIGVQLCLRRGKASEVLSEIASNSGASALYFHRGYSKGQSRQEAEVKQLCDKTGVECHRYGGFLLFEPEEIKTGNNEPYKVYTPFSKACFAAGVARKPKPAPDSLTGWQGNLASDDLADWSLYDGKPDWASNFSERFEPGEKGARDALEEFLDGPVDGYADDRDVPGKHSTSRLSPHLHFGEISPLQVWRATEAKLDTSGGKVDRGGAKFLKEVLWREFSWHLLFNWPDLHEESFRPEFNAFPWRDDCEALKRWQKGETGYPIVDAGMRELWATGWMHNRVRMVVASFLIKHLLINWRDGERWFWDCLVDADDANNAASWQWVAGSGADAAPYFRIFNPILQGEKFDGKGDYVRRWCPELEKLPNEFVHKPWEAGPLVLKEAGIKLGEDYPEPMVDHGFARKRALAALDEMKQENT